MVGLLPPLVTSRFHRRLERTFPSFPAAASASPGVYASDKLGKFRVERAKLNIHRLSSVDLAPAYAFLLVGVHTSDATEPVIVDFGGACGEWGYALKKDSRRRFRYVVVENADLVRRVSQDPFFDWFSCTTEIPSALDIFLTSGALQYLEAPYDVLALAFARATQYVVLGRNCFSEVDLFRVEKSRLGENGFGEALPVGFDADEPVYYPHRTLSYGKVLRLASEAGWRLMLQAESQSGVLPYRDQVTGRDLLFVRTR
jgi:putative methyltransferase (TIGR04325 family)